MDDDRSLETWQTFREKEITDCQAAQGAGEQRLGIVGQMGMQLLAGVLLWLLTLSMAVGMATFAFFQMPTKTSLAISMQIFGCALSFLWLGMRSMNPGNVAAAGTVDIVYISTFTAATVAQELPETTEISTVLLFVWLATFAQGVVFVICSRYSMGNALQYFPRSVIIGYNGGVGLLVFNAAVSLVSGVNPLKDRDAFLQAGPLMLTLPSLLVAVIVHGSSLNKTLAASPAFKVAPLILVTLAFYMELNFKGIRLEEAREAGWVFPATGWANPTDAVHSFQLSAVDWNHLQRQGLPLLPPMLLLSMVSQYASVGTMLTQIADSTKDADNETKHLGCANMACGLMGAFPTLSSVGPSTVLLGIVGKRGARGACLIVCGALHLMLFISGFPLVAFIPKCSIAGCLLMPMSFKMIQGALFQSLATSTWGDYIIIWVMSMTTLLSSVQWGLLSGFVLTVFQLIYEYAHYDVVSQRQCLSDVCTVKERPRQIQQVLSGFGDEVLSFRLRGVLFFANCVSFKLELQQLLEHPDKRPPKFIVVDFTEVSYADTSVWDILANFSVRANAAAASEVVLCAFSSALLEDLSRLGVQLRSSLKMDHLQHSYLHTLEQLEDKMLGIVSEQDPGFFRQVSDSTAWSSLVEFVSWGFLQGTSGVDLDRGGLETKLQKYFSKASFEDGEIVQEQDLLVESFYFVCSGEFHVFSAKTAASWSKHRTLPYQGGFSSSGSEMPEDHEDGDIQYLHRKLVAGFVEGVEMFCHEDGGHRMESYTTVQCKTGGSILRLSRDSFQQMRKEDLELCVALLLSTSSRREGLRRRHVLNSFEPEEVEVVNGARRAFTTAFSKDDLDVIRSKSLSRFDVKSTASQRRMQVVRCNSDADVSE